MDHQLQSAIRCAFHDAAMTHAPARVVLVHNSYRWPGGEDRVFATEAQVLRDHGHDVFTYHRENPSGGLSSLQFATGAFWNRKAYAEVSALVARVAPAVVHVHNTFPLLSPSVFAAARDGGAAVVQTLHNYRYMCPNGLLFRSGTPCADCVGTAVPWPAVVHACYRGSRLASGVAAAALTVHRTLNSLGHVHRFIALTDFSKSKFVEAGLPAERIVTKPNVIAPDTGVGSGTGGYALFIGRLSPEKGISTLLAAAPAITKMLPLMIIGDGPVRDQIQSAAQANDRITWLGQRTPAETIQVLGEATCLIVPSIWYETFGLTVAEAFSKGTPVVASRLGALQELVGHDRTGRHFTAGDATDLAAQVQWIMDHDQEVAAMRRRARAEYESRYSVQANYPVLNQIYNEAIEAAR
jgi:glycosyltransferase involved in cell wall biosynthesis